MEYGHARGNVRQDWVAGSRVVPDAQSLSSGGGNSPTESGKSVLSAMAPGNCCHADKILAQAKLVRCDRPQSH